MLFFPIKTRVNLGSRSFIIVVGATKTSGDLFFFASTSPVAMGLYKPPLKGQFECRAKSMQLAFWESKKNRKTTRAPLAPTPRSKKSIMTL